MNQYLTNEDKDILTDYIVNMGNGSSNIIESFIEHWQEAKSQYLFKLFGNELIISKMVNNLQADENYIEHEYNILYDKYYHKMVELEHYFQKRETTLIPCRKYYPWRSWLESTLNQKDSYCVIHFPSLIFPRDLSLGKTVEDFYFIENANFSMEKNYLENSPIKKTFPRGGKISRLLNHFIIPLIKDEEYRAEVQLWVDEFFVEYSRIKQTSTFSGELCISIHPMDYITMSDNSYRWHSCMSWENDGEYKVGTLEMCNSPMCVVAYLKGSEEFCGWNNKKWRELFLINEQLILGIKGYPYHSGTLEKEVMNMLKDLAVKNCDWEPANTEPIIDRPSYDITVNPELNISWDVEFDGMYNDCYSSHPIYVNQKTVTNGEEIMLYPSGQAYCIICGEKLWSEENGQSWLYCPFHDGRKKCSQCGYWIAVDDEYIGNDGEVYCEDCWEEYREEEEEE